MSNRDNQLTIFVISDSIGETGELIAKSSARQFESENYEIIRYPYHNSIDQIKPVLEKASRIKNSLIVYTNVVKETREFIKEKTRELNLHTVDVMGEPMRQIEDILGYEPLREPGLIRRLDENYFKKVECVSLLLSMTMEKILVVQKNRIYVLWGFLELQKLLFLCILPINYIKLQIYL